jgi:two-component system chemotaxis response regulator CheY
MESGKTILIVDDEEILREAIGAIFEHLGMRVLQAANGLEALDVVARETVHVVISDLRMPVMDGITFLRELQRRKTVVPVVIFMTGYSELSTEEIFGMGGSAIFPKPFNHGELLAVVRRFLNQGIALLESIPEPALYATELSEDSIGKGGFRVRAAKKFRRGEKIGFKIEFAAAGAYLKLEGSGVVRWLKEDGEPLMGVEILGLTEVSRALFIAWRKVRRPSSYIPRFVCEAEPGALP